MRMKRRFQCGFASCWALYVLFSAGGLSASPLDREYPIQGEDNGANTLRKSKTPTALLQENALESVDLAPRKWDFDQNLNVSAEGLFTSDFQVTQYTIQYGHDYKATQWDFGLTYDKYRIDVRSPDALFQWEIEQRLGKEITEISSDAERKMAQLNLTHSLNNRIVWQGQTSYYEGFQNFRMLWLRDYYREVYSIGGYPDVSPRGYQLGTQLRWEYLPASGYLEANFSYYKDWIAPSADEGPDGLELGRGVIDSFAYRLASENVLSPRLRSLLEVQMTDTMAREKRWGVQGSLNAAISESLVLRAQGGWVTENPPTESERSEFKACFVGATLEHNWTDAWLVSVFGRYYRDKGEFQNSLPASNASPKLKSYQVGLGTRWVGEKASVKITAGPYFTRYEAVDDDTRFFEDLYKSRDWAAVQFAFSMQF